MLSSIHILRDGIVMRQYSPDGCKSTDSVVDTSRSNCICAAVVTGELMRFLLNLRLFMWL